ncbi:selenium cofactor biosynthesis protein YqeC [uncultured Flavonifractor sp.]|uniref:selenium cofactor biosynthesis protein YqeC n=1 Tax=uncultured Flavonifractor sp. TaxID=1193534 RepID=UPI002608E9AB|nr:selenium cofactor biosynthesis protein YqeC [uncultured Flavonifractor sp.]
MGIWKRLNLDMDTHRLVALVGAGGKTSTLYALAREGVAAGRRVVITTTTHMMPHPNLPLTDAVEALPALLEQHPAVTLGQFLRPDKLSQAGRPEECLRWADLVLVEADGARLRPLKAPADHEPVIPSGASGVVALAGLDCLGKPVGEICHRPERVCALLGVGEEHLLTPADVAAVLSSPWGGRKDVTDGMAFRCLLNKADTPERAAWGREIQADLARRGIFSAVNHYTEKERGGICLF